jgi:hypothetical protein
VLKALWCDCHQSRPGWIQRYRELETHSLQIRRTALTILQNLLPGK